MRRNRSRLFSFVLLFAFAAIFGSVAAIVIGIFSFWIAVIVFGTTFLVFSILYTSLRNSLRKRVFNSWVDKGYNHLIYNFTRNIRVSFSISDFINVVKKDLEEGADFAVIWMDRKSGKIHYRSPVSLTASVETAKIIRNRYAGLSKGVNYLDKDFNLTDCFSIAKVILFASETSQLYLFSKYFEVYDPVLFQKAFIEYEGYLDRVQTIEEMFTLSAKSREWELLAETQMSFLPTQLPDLPGLELDAYFKALVNVSGDYYNVIPLDEYKTLIFLGDVSGKGLSAALIMGIIMNTIQITENKENLKKVVLNIDRAIKEMNFNGKYTTLFISIYDRKSSQLRFINAGMPEPLLVNADEIKELPGTSCPIGIMDMQDMEELELEIHPGDFLFIGSDGVTEAMNSKKEQLGDTEEFRELLKNSDNGSLQDFSNNLVSLVHDYTSGEKLRDDLTFLVVRVRGDE